MSGVDHHGPEGLTVKNGNRIDGPHSNDDDLNAFRRSSLTISRQNHIEIGEKLQTDVDSTGTYLDRFYNAVGGGPLIVLNGEALSNAAACGGRGNGTVDKFSSNVCGSSVQSASGVTRDGRTLVLVMSGTRDASQLSQLLVEQGVYTAMKLDGGGSAQLWYDGTAFYGGTERRPVADSLAVFSTLIPEFAATMTDQPGFVVLNPGESATLYVEMRNEGRQSWAPGKSVQLVQVGGELLGATSPQDLASTVSTGSINRWIFKLSAPGTTGLHQSIWQMKHNNTEISQAVTINVIVLPPEAKELRQKIEQQIDEWKKQGEQKADELLKQVTEEIKNYLGREVDKGVRSLCGTPAAILLIAVGVVINSKRKRNP